MQKADRWERGGRVDGERGVGAAERLPGWKEMALKCPFWPVCAGKPLWARTSVKVYVPTVLAPAAFSLWKLKV